MSRPYPHTLREEVKEILREEIRYRAKDVIFPVLRAKDVGLKVGVGTPFIIKDLNTDQSYMLFTGWDDVEGQQRRVFIIPIDKDLNINTSKVKEIVRPTDFGVTGVNCVHAFWDDLNEEWVLFHTFYGVSANNTSGVAFLDKEFNLKNTQMLTFTRANGTSANLGDGGISPIPLANKNLLLTAEIGYDRSCWLISNYTERPLPTPTQINTYNTTLIRIVPSCFSTGLAVHQTILLNSGIVMLSELCHNRTTWFLQVFYGPERDLIVHNTIIPVTFVSPVTPPLPFHFTDVVGNIGHPHYTNLLNEPYLFFARFPTWYAGGSRSYAHEVWVARIPPEVLLPWGKTLVVSGLNEPYILPDVIPIPTFGAKTASIYLFGVSTTGTLTVTQSSSPYHIFKKTAIRYQDKFKISRGSNRIVIDHPAPYIALGLDVNLQEWMVILYS